VILNTRPALYGERFHQAFAALNEPIVDCPVLAPVAINVTLPPPDGFDAVIFTSQVAVTLFPSDAVWHAKKAYAVGPVTAAAARDAGFSDVIATGYDAIELTRAIALADFKRALYPSARDVTSDLELAFPGRIRRVETYAMIAQRTLPEKLLRDIAAGETVIAPLFSRRSAIALADLLNNAGIRIDTARITAVGLSAKVLDGIPGPWRAQAVAANPTLDSVVDAASHVLGNAA